MEVIMLQSFSFYFGLVFLPSLYFLVKKSIVCTLAAFGSRLKVQMTMTTKLKTIPLLGKGRRQDQISGLLTTPEPWLSKLGPYFKMPTDIFSK
jgi:hypothetical protein